MGTAGLTRSLSLGQRAGMNSDLLVEDSVMSSLEDKILVVSVRQLSLL